MYCIYYYRHFVEESVFHKWEPRAGPCSLLGLPSAKDFATGIATENWERQLGKIYAQL